MPRLSLNYLQMVNIVLVRINQPEIVTLVGVTGVPKNIANKFKVLIDQIATETDWWIHIQTRTFSTVPSQAVYALAADFLKPALLLDISTRRSLTLQYPRTFELESINNVNGTARFATIEANDYVLSPIPGTVVTLKDIYWRSPVEISLDVDVPDLPTELQYSLIESVLGSQNEDMREFEKADRNFRKFQSAFDKVLETNQKRINVILTQAQEPLAFNGTFPFIEGAGIGFDLEFL